MLLRLSRLSFWLALAVAGLALFGPEEQRSQYTDGALALAAAAFMLWRAAIVLQQRLERRGDGVPDSVPLAAEALREAEALILRAAADAPGLEAALHRVGELLRGELGARAVRVFLVAEEDGVTGLAELVAAQPGFRAPRRAVALDDTAVGRALRAGRACVDLPRTIVLPVVREGRAIALLELVGIHMTIDEGALAPLLEAAAQALERHAGGPAAARPPSAPACRSLQRARRAAGLPRIASGAWT